ncbi:MAG: glycosyltransferase family 4 protein [Candidatus Omnitrophica bacterium]|nr:glycosyltransferase family 4 protein [Candidatus Omnitrophota bacterium]
MTESLQVLHLNTWDNAGGSGRASYRLHQGLKKRGVRSRMLVGHKRTDDPDVALMGSFLDRLAGGICNAAGFHYLFYPSSLRIHKHPWVREADIIQMYNTHGAYFSHWVLARLSQEKPVIWRLSDMWALTGHCSYSYECERWKTGCGSCPHLKEYPALPWDITGLLWKIKDRIYSRSRLAIVCPSRWLMNLAMESPLLNRFPIHWIPNGLDLELFRPHPKKEAKNRFGIPQENKVILFSASSILSPRKGAAYLTTALGRLNGSLAKTTLLIVGAGARLFESRLSVDVKRVEAVEGDEPLSWIYSAADLFVLPTLADNLPNGILESMACGTPAVSFRVGGVPEAVRHMETGYAAAPGAADDLSKGIRLLLEDDLLRERMGRRCREVTEREYGEETQTDRFEKLYREILKERR